MKLTDQIKEKIDNYFNNISAVELYEISVKKYGFEENAEIEIDNQSFETIQPSFYSKLDNSINLGISDPLPFAA